MSSAGNLGGMGGATPLATAREIVLSKSSLMGICLIAFACGIVTTVMADRARSRVSDHETVAHDPNPTSARTSPSPEPAAPVSAAGAPTVAPVAPTIPAASAVVAPPPPAATANAPAAGDPVVVQMPNLDEASRRRPPVAAHSPAPIVGRPRAVVAPAAIAKAKPALGPTPASAKVKPAVKVGAPPATGKGKPAIPAASKKAKTANPDGPPAWVDPFTL